MKELGGSECPAHVRVSTRNGVLGCFFRKPLKDGFTAEERRQVPFTGMESSEINQSCYYEGATKGLPELRLKVDVKNMTQVWKHVFEIGTVRCEVGCLGGWNRALRQAARRPTVLHLPSMKSAEVVLECSPQHNDRDWRFRGLRRRFQERCPFL